MNKGLKSYTKLLTANVGNAAECSLNVNKYDANLHIVIPIIESVGMCKIKTALIYDHSSRNTDFGYGKGIRLNFYSSITSVSGGYEMENPDGSSDIYYATNQYYNSETQMYVKASETSGYAYEVRDQHENVVRYTSGSTYPSVVQKKIGDCIYFEKIVDVIKITNDYGDRINITKNNGKTQFVYFHDNSTVCSAEVEYDSDGYISSVKYYTLTDEIAGQLNFSLSSTSCTISDAIGGYGVKYTFALNSIGTYEPTAIIDGYGSNFEKGRSIAIECSDHRTKLTDDLGNVSYTVFHNDNYPQYDIDSTGCVRTCNFDRNTNLLIGASNPFNTAAIGTDLIDDAILTYSASYSGVVSVSGDSLKSSLVGSSMKKYTGSGDVTYKIAKGGLPGDNVTACIFGEFQNTSYLNITATVTLKLLSDTGNVVGSSTAIIRNISSGAELDAAVLGVAAKSGYTSITLTVSVPNGYTLAIGGARVRRSECGVTYTYDSKGNVVEAASGNRSKSSSYNQYGLAGESLGVNSDLVNYEYDEKLRSEKSTHAYGAAEKCKYDPFYNERVYEVSVENHDGTTKLRTVASYGPTHGRFMDGYIDANGLSYDMLYDNYGNVSEVRDALSVITTYTYVNKDLLSALKLTDRDISSKTVNVAYGYDDRKRLSSIGISNGSEYTFEYDNANNITRVKLNGTVIFRYTYDAKNRLTTQYCGEYGGHFEFAYDSKGRLYEIYYLQNSQRTLKYRYVYDILNRVSNVTDSSGNYLYRYTYDDDGRIKTVKTLNCETNYTYDALGDVELKSTTANEKNVIQSFSNVKSSKGDHPESLLGASIMRENGAYFGMFNTNGFITNYSGAALSPIDHSGNAITPVLTRSGLVPCCSVNSSNLLSYRLSMESIYSAECGFVSFCFKPTTMRYSCIFSCKDPNSNGSIRAYMNANGTVNVIVTDNNGNGYSIMTLSTAKHNEWNYFALSFYNRHDEGSNDITEFVGNLNGNIQTYKKSNPRIYFELGVYPIYNIGHFYSGATDFDHLWGYVTAVNIGSRRYMSLDDIKLHGKIVSDYLCNNVVTQNGVSTVDFSSTNVYTDNSTVKSKFKIYPLNNTLNALDGTAPMRYNVRVVSDKDKNRTFKFNKISGRNAFVADGNELRYHIGSSSSGTVAVRAYTDVTYEKQYFFDMKDTSGHTLGLFRDERGSLAVNINGTEISFDLPVSNGSWHTVGLSFSKELVSDSTVGTTTRYVNIRAFLGTTKYDLRREVSFDYGTLELTVGKAYTSTRVSCLGVAFDDYHPLYGQLEMLAIGNAYNESSTINTLVSELNTYTQTVELDELGMQRRSGIKHGETDILKKTVEYKKNGNYTTPAVSRETFTYGNTTRTRDYTTDEYGRVTEVVDSVLGTNKYKYDYCGYLIKENTTEYIYDNNGNMTKKNGYFVTCDSTIKDRLSKINGDNVYYNSQNPLNPSSCGDLTFEFEGRRLTYCYNMDFDAEYIYNNEGLRIKKCIDDGFEYYTVNYAYEGTKLVCEYTTSKRMDYLYDGNGILYGLIYNGNKYFYLRDHLANILGIIDSSGNLVVSYDYSAYGNLKSITGSMATTLGKDNHMRYKGYYFDEETGFYYCKSRYYVPEWCRWLNADNPAYLKPYSATGNNLFAYCENNPVMYMDSFGDEAKLVTMYTLGGGGLPIVGHCALFIKVGENDWYFTQFAGNSKKNASIELTYIGNTDPLAYLESQYSTKYTSITLDGDYSNSLVYAQGEQGSDRGGYNFFTNNCSHYVADVLKEGENNSSIVQWWHDVSRVRVPSLLHATTYLSIELQECADWLENKYQNIRDFLGV